MPLETRTYDLAEELEELRDRRDELAEQVASLDEANPGYQDVLSEGQEVDNHIAGLEWALEEWTDGDETVEVTLAGLTGGEYGRVQDRVAGTDKGGGAARVHLVASGTVDAPNHDPDAEYEANLAAASQLPFQYLKWAEAQVNDLTSVGGNGGRSFAALVREKQSTSDETSPETT